MAKTSVLNIRIDSNLKESAEAVLKEIGISPSDAVTAFYGQIVKHKGLPFELALFDETSETGEAETAPTTRKIPAFLDSLTREELDRKIAKGLESAKNEKCYTREEVEAELKRRHEV